MEVLVLQKVGTNFENFHHFVLDNLKCSLVSFIVDNLPDNSPILTSYIFKFSYENTNFQLKNDKDLILKFENKEFPQIKSHHFGDIVDFGNYRKMLIPHITLEEGLNILLGKEEVYPHIVSKFGSFDVLKDLVIASLIEDRRLYLDKCLELSDHILSSPPIKLVEDVLQEYGITIYATRKIPFDVSIKYLFSPFENKNYKYFEKHYKDYTIIWFPFINSKDLFWLIELPNKDNKNNNIEFSRKLFQNY